MNGQETPKMARRIQDQDGCWWVDEESYKGLHALNEQLRAESTELSIKLRQAEKELAIRRSGRLSGGIASHEFGEAD